MGDCNYVIEKYGQYHEILEKMQRYEKALEKIAEDRSVAFWELSSKVAKEALDT